MMYKTYITTVFCQTTKKNNNNYKEHFDGAPFLYLLQRTIVTVKNNEILIKFLQEFMNFDVVLCYNKIDYVIEVGDSLSHF